MSTRDSDVTMSSERSFGLTFAAVFSVMAGIRWWRHGVVPVGLLAPAAVFLALALTYPRVLRPFNIVWFRFGLLLNRVTSPVVFGVIYAVAVVPTAFCTRLAGKRLMPSAIDRGHPVASYWIARVPLPDEQGMVNQF